MNWRLPMLLVAVLLCAPDAVASEPHVGGFVRYQAGEFVIVTSGDEKQVRSLISYIANTQSTLQHLIGKVAVPNHLPTTIVIAGDTDWGRWVMARPDVSAFFYRLPFTSYLAMNGSMSSDGVQREVLHEFTHYFLSSHFAGQYPTWFDEGLAELMGYAQFHDGKAFLEIPPSLMDDRNYGVWIPFERMIQVDEAGPEYQERKLARIYYAEAWLIMHVALVEDPSFGRQVFKYLDLINTLVPPKEAAQKAFGNDLGAVDRQLRAYLSKPILHAAVIRLETAPAPELGKAEALNEVDAMTMIANLVLDGGSPPDRVRPLVESLQRRDPNAARAAVLRAKLAQREEDTSAFDRAMTQAEDVLSPGDWRQRRDLAVVLLSRTGENTEPEVRRAMKWFDEAMSQNDQDLEALYGFGMTATNLGTDLDRAESALVSAYKLAPYSAEIARSLAELKAKQQRPEERLKYLEDVVRYARDLDTRRWAAQEYIATKKQLAERDKTETKKNE